MQGVGQVQSGDLLRFSFTNQGFGTTAGTWSRWLGASTLGLGSYDAELSALWVSGDESRVAFSAEDDYRYGSWRAQDEDLLVLNRSTGAVSVLLNTSRMGMRYQDVDGMHVLSSDALTAIGDPGPGSSSTGTGSSGSGSGSGSSSGGSSTTPTPNGPLTTYLVSTDDPGSMRLPDGSRLAFDDSDILALVVDSTGQLIDAGIYFDGSDVGLTTGKEDIKAFALDDQGNIYVTLKGKGTVTTPQGNLIVGVNDILKFTPTSLGTTTAGTWDWYFDGSDVGLFGDDERIEGLSFLPGGDLVISIHERGNVPGVGQVQSGDLLRFSFTNQGFGTTAGTWSRWLGASTLGFSPRDSELNALWVSSDGNRVGFSADDDYRHGNWRAQDEDILMFNRTTSSVSVLLNTTAMGMRSLDVDGLHIASGDLLATLSNNGGAGTTSAQRLALSLRVPASQPVSSPDSQKQNSRADDLLPQIDDSVLDDQGQHTSSLTHSADDQHTNQHTSLLDDDGQPTHSGHSDDAPLQAARADDLLPQIDDSVLDDQGQHTNSLTHSADDQLSATLDTQMTNWSSSWSSDDLRSGQSLSGGSSDSQWSEDDRQQFWRSDDDSLRQRTQAVDDAFAHLDLDYYEAIARQISRDLS